MTMKAGIVIGHLNNAGNEAALLRTAEAFGINHVHVLGTRRADYSISQGADQHMTFVEHANPDELLGWIRANNCELVAVENAAGAIPVGAADRYPANPVFVIGEEGQGVPARFIEKATQVRIIEQSPNGYTTCLNTTVAGSIVIHDWHLDCRERAVEHLDGTVGAVAPSGGGLEQESRDQPKEWDYPDNLPTDSS